MAGVPSLVTCSMGIQWLQATLLLVGAFLIFNLPLFSLYFWQKHGNCGCRGLGLQRKLGLCHLYGGYR